MSMTSEIFKSIDMDNVSTAVKLKIKILNFKSLTLLEDFQEYLP